jgi:hypothetical protein
MSVTGRAHWTWTCFSVLQHAVSVCPVKLYNIKRQHLQRALWPSHPISPYPLNLYGRRELLSQRCHLRRLVEGRFFSAPQTTQARRTSRILTVFKFVVLVAILSVIDGCRAALSCPRRWQRVRKRDNWRYQRIAIGSQTWRIARYKGLGRCRLSGGREHGCCRVAQRKLCETEEARKSSQLNASQTAEGGMGGSADAQSCRKTQLPRVNRYHVPYFPGASWR